ncbi:MAG: NAD(P)H-binding protein [Pseudomonadota bacterium]
MARALLVGATGTIGRAVAKELVAQGFETVCVVRANRAATIDGAHYRTAHVTDAAHLLEHGFKAEPFDVVISCLASRTGAPDDAWAIDYHANLNTLEAAAMAGCQHFVLLSAICVQKPVLAFQRAKIAFEDRLTAADITHSIIRPTAFFKSLSGQFDRVKAGKPFLLFADGALTACKPISDEDLARYIVRAVRDTQMHNVVLPIGGPGPAQTPRQQGEDLFEALGLPPKFRSVPIGMMDAIITGLSLGGRMFPKLAVKAELARIGRYYATESMLVWDPEQGRYDADATPSFGNDTLAGFFRQLASGEATVERGDHAVF